MKNPWMTLAVVVVAGLVAWKFYSSRELNQPQTSAETSANNGSGPQASPTDQADAPLPEWEPEDSSAAADKKTEVLTKFEIIPSTVGGVVALKLPGGEEFVTSVSRVAIVPCAEAPKEMCLGITRGRQVKVNAELRKLLPQNAHFHINHPK